MRFWVGIGGHVHLKQGDRLSPITAATDHKRTPFSATIWSKLFGVKLNYRDTLRNANDSKKWPSISAGSRATFGSGVCLTTLWNRQGDHAQTSRNVEG